MEEEEDEEGEEQEQEQEKEWKEKKVRKKKLDEKGGRRYRLNCAKRDDALLRKDRKLI